MIDDESFKGANDMWLLIRGIYIYISKFEGKFGLEKYFSLLYVFLFWIPFLDFFGN